MATSERRRLVLVASLSLFVAAWGCQPPTIEVEPNGHTSSRAISVSAGSLNKTYLVDDRGDLYANIVRSGRVSLADDLTFEPFVPLAQVDIADNMCGLTPGGDLYCDTRWIGVDEEDLIPPDQATLSGVISFSVAPWHICAVTEGRDLFCWGLNVGGVLLHEGWLFAEPRLMPLDDVVSVSAGNPTCVITSSGALTCWAYRIDEDQEVISPVEVEGLPAIAAVSTSGSAGRLCALSRDHRAYCWSMLSGEEPTELELADVRSIAVGNERACAVTRDGHLYCWGSNTLGQLGVGDTEPREEPTRVELEGVIQVDVAYIHTVAITSAGDLYCWGNPRHRQSRGPLLTPTRYLW